MHPARSRAVRRWFFLALSLSMTVILLARFLIFHESANAPDWEKTAQTVLDNLLAAAVTSLAIGLAYVLLFPESEPDSVVVVQPGDIADILASATRATSEWSVKARTANYFARVTLPQLKSAALKTGRSVRIRVLVLDPAEESLLAHYARYSGHRPGAAGKWTVEKSRVEVYSTILAIAYAVYEAPRLEIVVGFSSGFWVLSLDLSDDVAIVTGQNKLEPALCVRKVSPMFRGWREDFDAEFSVCRQLVPPGLKPILDVNGPQGAIELNGFLDALGLPAVCESDAREILHFAETKHNYA